MKYISDQNKTKISVDNFCQLIFQIGQQFRSYRNLSSNRNHRTLTLIVITTTILRAVSLMH